MISFSICLVILLAVALGLDCYKYIIPNWLVGLVIVLYPAMVLLSPTPVDWLTGIYVFVGMFFAGFLIFSLKIMGGGDVKLLAALGLWTGTQALLDLVFLTAIYGGVLAVGLIIVRKLAPWMLSKIPGEHKIPKIFTIGEPLPYGVAIAIAFLTILIKGQVPGLPSPI